MSLWATAQSVLAYAGPQPIMALSLRAIVYITAQECR